MVALVLVVLLRLGIFLVVAVAALDLRHPLLVRVVMAAVATEVLRLPQDLMEQQILEAVVVAVVETQRQQAATAAPVSSS
jgi:hypothetical protein